MDFRVFSRNISENMHARCVREDTKQALKGNLQADGVQSRQTLFVRYCLNKKTGFLLENPVFCLVRFLQLAAFEMQEEGVKRDMVGEDFTEEIPCHTAVCLRNFYAICRKI